jgi:hypothetical protein
MRFFLCGEKPLRHICLCQPFGSSTMPLSPDKIGQCFNDTEARHFNHPVEAVGITCLKLQSSRSLRYCSVMELNKRQSLASPQLQLPHPVQAAIHSATPRQAVIGHKIGI